MFAKVKEEIVPDISTNTNDHIVPRMYLKRFAIERPGGPQLQAAHAETPDKEFPVNIRNVGAEKSFYWGTGPDGVPTHDMETFLTTIESEAAPAFRTLLDKGKLPGDNALPERWPPRPETRLPLAWWLAAQLIRTAPQRERLWRLHGDDPLEPPRSLRRADLHHAYIVKAVAPLAALIYARPWGVGFTNLCLLTSDAPVQVLNAASDDDPLATATFWDIYLPLDSHRFLYLPGEMHASQRRLMCDHRINLPGGLAIPLNHEVLATAHRHVMWHARHDPRPRIDLSHALATRHTRRTDGLGGSIMRYVPLDDEFGIERRWLDNHTWDTDAVSGTSESGAGPMSDMEVVSLAQEMADELQTARAKFERRRHP